MKFNTTDEYLNSLPGDQRAALKKLRQTIKAVAPKAEECISYALPAFRLDGRVLVTFGSSTNHCSFYPSSATTVAALADDLKNYDTSKGTIRFPANKPLPTTLVRKIVKVRIAENAVRNEKAKTPKSAKSLRVAKPKKNKSQTDPAVIAFLKDLDHPLKSAIEAVRKLILGVSPEIHEGIKWNSPSFRTTEYFATLNLRDGRVWLILHLGAKAKTLPKGGLKIADPTGLLKWLGKDRALVTFADAKDVKAKSTALSKVLNQWTQFI